MVMVMATEMATEMVIMMETEMVMVLAFGT